MPFFSPPLVTDLPLVNAERQGRPGFSLFRHFSPLTRGQTVIKLNGVYQTVQHPSQSTLDLATEIYLGGHCYAVSEAVSAALTAAGYTTWPTPEAAGTVHSVPRIPSGMVDTVFPGYGSGTYGGGLYGEGLAYPPNEPGPAADPETALFYTDFYTDTYSEVT